MEINEFIKKIEECNIPITEKKLEQLEKYYSLIIEWNEKINLTGITEKKEVYLKHFYDSATLSKIIDLEKVSTLCDIGTGAGFPGIVIKIFYPHLQITLLDSLHKRIVFLEEVVQKLELENVIIIEGRAEEYAKTHREIFDVVTSRAVAPLSILMEYSIPLVKIGKYFIPMKAKIENEKDSIDRLCEKLSSTLEKKLEFHLPIEESVRTLLAFKKRKATASKYPRKYSEMKKKPL